MTTTSFITNNAYHYHHHYHHQHQNDHHDQNHHSLYTLNWRLEEGVDGCIVLLTPLLHFVIVLLLSSSCLESTPLPPPTATSTHATTVISSLTLSLLLKIRRLWSIQFGSVPWPIGSSGGTWGTIQQRSSSIFFSLLEAVVSTWAGMSTHRLWSWCSI